MYVHEVEVQRPSGGRTVYRVKGPNPDFVYVDPTVSELDAYRAKNGGRTPARNAKRAVCLRCSKRIWASGIALGTHVHDPEGEPTTPAAVKNIT